MKILTIPNKILYQQADPVGTIGEEIQGIVDRMFTTMYQHKGIGLAANQVGVLKQIIVLNLRYSPMVFINPVIHLTGSELVNEFESCLSIPGCCKTVERPERIYIESLNRYGKEQNFEVNGLLARVIQHEHDHLWGRLINNHE